MSKRKELKIELMKHIAVITKKQLDERVSAIITLIHLALLHVPDEELSEVLEMIETVDRETISQLRKKAKRYEEIIGDKEYEDVKRHREIKKYMANTRIFFDYFYDDLITEVK